MTVQHTDRTYADSVALIHQPVWLFEHLSVVFSVCNLRGVFEMMLTLCVQRGLLARATRVSVVYAIYM